jgi:hypothetical protein
MTPRLLFVPCFLLLITLTAVADDAEELRRLDKELTVATWTGDAVWFEQNLSDDYLLITPNGAIRTKRDLVSELATPGLKMEPFEATEVQVRVHGDAAILTGRMRQQFLLGRTHSTSDLRYTDVYVKKKGRWLMVSGHASNIPKK